MVGLFRLGGKSRLRVVLVGLRRIGIGFLGLAVFGAARLILCVVLVSGVVGEGVPYGFEETFVLVRVGRGRVGGCAARLSV